MSRPAYDYDRVGNGVEDVTTLPEDRQASRPDARVVTLVRRLADDVTTLFTKELALLKVETTSAIADTRAGIGAIMLASGKKKLEPSAFKPEHTQASMKKDRDMIKRNIHESHQR